MISGDGSEASKRVSKTCELEPITSQGSIRALKGGLLTVTPVDLAFIKPYSNSPFFLSLPFAPNS